MTKQYERKHTPNIFANVSDTYAFVWREKRAPKAKGQIAGKRTKNNRIQRERELNETVHRTGFSF